MISMAAAPPPRPSSFFNVLQALKDVTPCKVAESRANSHISSAVPQVALPFTKGAPRATLPITGIPTVTTRVNVHWRLERSLHD